MAFGPTQNYDDASLGVWKGRPILAGAIRTLIAAVPVVLSIGLGLAAVHWFPPRRLGVNPWIWMLVEICCATVVLVLASRLGRRFLPLTTLLRLTLYFPDRAPSRLAVAMSHYSPNALQARLVALRHPRELRPDDEHAARILGLVAAISDHDQLTRGHSERVQAYSALIGKELGLSGQDAAKLSWAALLHDIGKLSVPASLLSKPGEPTTKEWDVLAGHPEAGMEIVQPLGEWLGPWLDVIGQHHERWDGAGYPAGLAGEAINRGARIVAVADAYDVITSARSYKRALPASAARAELARCAGEQFDPQVVRAFLAIGLGSLRRVAGPLSVLSVLPGLPSFATDLPSVVQRVTTAGALKSTGAIGLMLSVSTATAAGIALADVPLSPESATSVPGGDVSTGTPRSGDGRGGAAPTSPGSTNAPETTPPPASIESAPPLPVPAPSTALPPIATPPPTQDPEDSATKAKKVKKEKKAKEDERS
ncbi:HD-GYP domain-containing protein [Cellulomonas sp. Root137]|uniref:HD-GYP domain-containing protein n=1 Tax=Cellulomonas sp. Root137 TaxID=1736459 RepID=UPI0006F8398F|nr:HD-GYP domain-containing protein [Cellulomonas sp. Root137]KQY43888.1 hypothetical protein ASD18_16205 [Cellulomonas sp. Root137]